MWLQNLAVRMHCIVWKKEKSRWLRSFSLIHEMHWCIWHDTMQAVCFSATKIFPDALLFSHIRWFLNLKPSVRRQQPIRVCLYLPNSQLRSFSVTLGRQNSTSQFLMLQLSSVVTVCCFCIASWAVLNGSFIFFFKGFFYLSLKEIVHPKM